MNSVLVIGIEGWKYYSMRVNGEYARSFKCRLILPIDVDLSTINYYTQRLYITGRISRIHFSILNRKLISDNGFLQFIDDFDYIYSYQLRSPKYNYICEKWWKLRSYKNIIDLFKGDDIVISNKQKFEELLNSGVIFGSCPTHGIGIGIFDDEENEKRKVARGTIYFGY